MRHSEIFHLKWLVPWHSVIDSLNINIPPPYPIRNPDPNPNPKSPPALMSIVHTEHTRALPRLCSTRRRPLPCSFPAAPTQPLRGCNDHLPLAIKSAEVNPLPSHDKITKVVQRKHHRTASSSGTKSNIAFTPMLTEAAHIYSVKLKLRLQNANLTLA